MATLMCRRPQSLLRFSMNSFNVVQLSGALRISGLMGGVCTPGGLCAPVSIVFTSHDQFTLG